uniref:Uncharacterized protein n=1 Tax=Sander lucioperca TaxID=283035 RepID=A0A8D0A7S8_SANLU
MKGSGKALTLHSSFAALPSTRTTSLRSCRILGGPFSRSSLRDLCEKHRNIRILSCSKGTGMSMMPTDTG